MPVRAIDVGRNQLDWKIRQDPRVVVHEKVNARSMDYTLIGQKVDLIVMDLSFISLEKVIPATLQFSNEQTDWVCLVKPQFEVGKDKVGKGGIVENLSDRLEAVERVSKFAESLGMLRKGLIESPITGTQGNQEFLVHWKRGQTCKEGLGS